MASNYSTHAPPEKPGQRKVETLPRMSPVDREETGDEEVPFNEEWIAYALKQVELGMAVGEVCRKQGIAEATFYVWRRKYRGLGPSERLSRLRLLEEENRKWSQKGSEACPEACLGGMAAGAIW